MKHTIEDIAYAQSLFDRFYNIGAIDSGGVTRLGYSEVEDEMHRAFIEAGAQDGYTYTHDEVGNTYVGYGNMQHGSILIGSHLDSVIDGGRYDGVAGIIAGLMVLHWAKQTLPDINISVGAFRCEESSNFGRCTIGSGLITKEIYKNDMGSLIGKDGRSLHDIFEERGYDLNPSKIPDIDKYLELHIEQGKILEEYNTEVGIVTTIAGPRRFLLHVIGNPEHSGATPMDMRRDALCAASEIVLEIEGIGKEEAMYQSVATVGTLEIKPNALNVIPGEVNLGVDMRGIDQSSLERMENRLKNSAQSICKKRGMSLFIEKLSVIPPIELSNELGEKLGAAAKRLGLTYRMMPSGAGHDAMSFAPYCEASMVFIPCVKGISHNKREFTSIESILDGAAVMYEYLKECEKHDFD
ncbi:MAG: hydantoinase/carbamoylase family amidase [Erysipelotrichaceae bacterium]